MFIEILDYSKSGYADGETYHEPGKCHKLTPPSKITINSHNIISIERNLDFLKGTFVGGPCVGQCDYFIRMIGDVKFYIMRDEAERLLKIL